MDAAGDAAAAAVAEGAADDGSLDLHTQVRGENVFMRCLLFSLKSNRSKKRHFKFPSLFKKYCDFDYDFNLFVLQFPKESSTKGINQRPDFSSISCFLKNDCFGRESG